MAGLPFWFCATIIVSHLQNRKQIANLAVSLATLGLTVSLAKPGLVVSLAVSFHCSIFLSSFSIAVSRLLGGSSFS
jgi:hypothetical protein